MWSDQSRSVGSAPGRHVELAAQELAERLAAGVDVLAVAVGEVHRHVEQVVDVALEAETILEHEVEHAGAVRIGVGPDVRAVRQVTVGLAFGERRVGEQRGGDRLQRQRHAELLHHVGFAAEVEVDLHRAGAGHHVEAEVAALGHVLAHDLVAALGHPRHLVATPLGLEAHAEEAELQFLRDRLDLGEVLVGFAAGFVDVFERRAGEFELAGRLERDRGAIAEQARWCGHAPAPASSRSGSGRVATPRCRARRRRSAGAGRRGGNRTSRARCRCASPHAGGCHWRGTRPVRGGP
jgi:hypothetical protein